MKLWLKIIYCYNMIPSARTHPHLMHSVWVWSSILLERQFAHITCPHGNFLGSTIKPSTFLHHSHETSYPDSSSNALLRFSGAAAAISGHIVTCCCKWTVLFIKSVIRSSDLDVESIHLMSSSYMGKWVTIIIFTRLKQQSWIYV